MGNYCNKIYGTSTYSNVYVTYNTDAETEPGGYTSALLLRNGTAGMEYDASGEETLTFYHGYGGNGSAINWNFASPAGTKMTLLGSGNLGVGTLCPKSTLDIYQAGLGTTNSGTVLNLRGGNNSTSYGTNQIVFNYGGGAGSNSYAHAIKSRHQSGGPSTNALDFFIWTTAVDASCVGTKNVMTLDGTGTVGIGTCLPYNYGALAIRTAVCLNSKNVSLSTSDGINSTFDVRHPVGSVIDLSSQNSALTFSTNPTTSDGIERMRITTAGFIGIGTVSPDTKLTIQAVCNDEKSFSIRSSYSVCVPVIEAGTTGADGYLKIRDGANCTWTSLSGYSATPTYLLNNVAVGSTSPGSYKLYVNGAFYAAGSSCEYKTQICNYNTDSCLFMKLKPVTYQYKDEWCHLGKELKSGTQIGLIAEETAEVFPELAILKDEENEKVVRNVDYEKLTIILLSELQKLRQEVDQLKNK